MEEIPVDTSLLEQLVGKIANIDTLFPVWDNAVISEEKWTEPLNAETAKKIKYIFSGNLEKTINKFPIFNGK